MDLREIEGIIKLVEASGIDELEIEEGGTRVRIKKSPSSGQPFLIEHAMSAPAYGVPATAAFSPPGPGTPTTKFQPTEEAPPSNQFTITSPMVGTFYRSPSPDSAPFVQIGTEVQDDAVVCILEAMKVMNEIKAGCRGRIVEILVQNEQAVEFGQPLFKVFLA